MKEGWEIKKLKDVCSYDKEIVTNPDLPYVGLEHIESKSGKFVGTLKPTTVKSSTFHFTEKHVLYGRLRPYLNKVFLPFFEGHCSTEIFPISVTTRILREYLYYWFLLDSTVKKIDATRTGARMPRANMTQVSEFEIPLPPLSEQKKIVALLDDVLSRIDKARENIEKNIENAEELFESEYCKIFLDSNLETLSISETADSLLCEIHTERQKVMGLEYENLEKKLLPVSDEEIPFSIPNNWKWIRLGELLLSKPRNGYSPRPVNYQTNTKNLILTATTSGVFNPLAFKYIDEEISDDSYLWLNPGDLLIQRSNSLYFVGMSCIYTGNPHEFIYPDLMMKTRLSSFVDVRFIDYYLKSKYGRAYFMDVASGSARNMPKINQSDVVNCLIPLPPLSEQKRFVSYLDELRKQTYALKARYTKKLQDLDELRNSVLEKAFRGELT